jgi:hypothetical protein
MTSDSNPIDSDRLPGYPRFSSWVASDPNFAIGRDYADLRVRVRLHKQYKVEQLRTKLEKLDKTQHGIDPNVLKSIGVEIDEGYGERDALIEELGKVLKEFGKSVDAADHP